jgi:hypothetical protein
MRQPLIALDEIPERGLATAELMGCEVLVMLNVGSPRSGDRP